MDMLLILALSVINFFLAFIAVSVGGTGLIMTPLMISLGIPPAGAISAKRFSNLGVSSLSLPKFHREGKVRWRIGLPLIGATMLGSYMASNIIIALDPEVLERTIGILVIGMLAFILLNRRFGLEGKAKATGKRQQVAGFLVYVLVVFIANFVGGSGILTSFALITFFGLTFLESAATRKVAGIFGTLTAVAVYVYAGVLPFELAVPLFVSAAIGGLIGAHYALRKGDAWVRKIFLVVVAILGIRMLFF